jgi:hypothetical protein
MRSLVQLPPCCCARLPCQSAAVVGAQQDRSRGCEPAWLRLGRGRAGLWWAFRAVKVTRPRLTTSQRSSLLLGSSDIASDTQMAEAECRRAPAAVHALLQQRPLLWLAAELWRTLPLLASLHFHPWLLHHAAAAACMQAPCSWGSSQLQAPTHCPHPTGHISWGIQKQPLRQLPAYCSHHGLLACPTPGISIKPWQAHPAAHTAPAQRLNHSHL